MSTTNDDRPATKSQLAAMERLADQIERELAPFPYTRKQAREEIAELKKRVKELQEDGTIPIPGACSLCTEPVQRRGPSGPVVNWGSTVNHRHDRPWRFIRTP